MLTSLSSVVRLEDVFKNSWRHLSKMSRRHLENILETSLRHMTKTNIFVLTKTSWRPAENVFWRHMTFILIETSWRYLLEMKTKYVFKTSSRRLHQDKCSFGILYPYFICKCWTIFKQFIFYEIFWPNHCYLNLDILPYCWEQFRYQKASLLL